MAGKEIRKLGLDYTFGKRGRSPKIGKWAALVTVPFADW
jgi:hypothetical protein